MRPIRIALLLSVFSTIASAEPQRGAVTWTLALQDHSSASLEKLDAQIQRARVAGEPVMVDLFADWCGACRLLDRGALADSAVVQALAAFITIRIDVSEPDDFTAAVSERFSARALPTVSFISSRGKVSHLAGTISAKELLSVARKMR